MTYLNHNRWITVIVLGLASVLILSACKPKPMSTALAEPTAISSGDDAADLPYPEPLNDAASEDGDQSETGEDDMGSSDVYPAPEANPPPQPKTVQPSADAYPAPGKEIPRLKTELEATDPSTVSLASGEIQLVEFFAFW